VRTLLAACSSLARAPTSTNTQLRDNGPKASPVYNFRTDLSARGGTGRDRLVASLPNRPADTCAVGWQRDQDHDAQASRGAQTWDVRRAATPCFKLGAATSPTDGISFDKRFVWREGLREYARSDGGAICISNAALISGYCHPISTLWARGARAPLRSLRRLSLGAMRG
jgi:hypothetical protein